MSYSVEASQDSCYPGTNVLINKLGLHDQAALDQAERIVVTLHAAQLEAETCTAPLTFDFYRSLHRQLFQELYDWAGELRTINISKNGTAFYPAEELSRLGEAKFAFLISEREFQGLSRELFAERISDFYNDINLLHPFREGNGRTQRLFFSILIRRAGYKIDFAGCDMDALMMATIYAAQGVQTYLTQFFNHAIRES